MENSQVLLAKRPTGMPGPDVFALKNIAMPTPGQDQVLLKARYISVDPYMRGRMRAGESYVAPFSVNEPIHGGVVAEVVESKSKAFAPGDMVLGELPWQRFAAADATQLRKLDPSLAPVSTALGILGMPGLTAYFGLLDICKPKTGETVVVSGAAGAVGTTVGQIAKIKGARVVGIAGGEHKVRYLREELGFDATIDYKAEKDLQSALKKACPAGIDAYFDNVGGPISDAALTLINKFARIAICGQISLYNKEEVDVGPRPQLMLLTKSALMQGFLVFDYAERYPEGIKELAGWVKSGRLKYQETTVEGFDKLPQAFLGLFKGENIGKLIVKV